jgi:adenosylcobinamide kinase/adenosylcobinamide-phosphate guanylyltransferase
MDVVVLGTGAADGWPNPFCRCASCAWARERGEIRTTTAALIDGRILLDCGPEAPRQADRAGVGLADLVAVVVTHAHPDHLDPAVLLARSWAGSATPLRVLGPQSVLDACAHWVGPHDPVSLELLRPGDAVDVEGYVVRAWAATHDVGHDVLARDAVLLDVTAPDGGRILYATDTGPLPEPTLHGVRDAAFDVVLLEETFGRHTQHGTGHLDLDTFPRELARLRGVGAVGTGTDVVAVHLGHHNPPGPELDRLLHAWGARTVRDGDHVGTERVVPPSIPRRTLILGGARSGKSHEAERRLLGEAAVTYVATGGTRDDDADWLGRVAAHRSRRPSSWTTRETLDVAAILDAAGAHEHVLVDCLALWLAGTLDAAQVWVTEPGSSARTESLALVESDISRLVATLRIADAHVVLVSNEVGSGVVPEHESGRLYRDLLGRLNAALAAECDEVCLVVAGRVLPL